MAALTATNVYICANVLLAFAAALLELIQAMSSRLRRPMAYRHQLRMGQAMALAALLLPLGSSSCGRASLLPQTAQVWSAPMINGGALAGLTHQQTVVSFGASGASVPLDLLSQAAALVFAAGLLFVLARLLKDVAATLRIIAGAQTMKRRGSAWILASDSINVPFSFWVPARCFVVVPSALLVDGEALRLAIRHEVQHHRQHDTKLVYLHQIFRAAFFWNPAVHRLDRQLRELQEFSCDEAMGGQRSVRARDYCRCLLHVAEAATRQRSPQILTSMIGGGAGKLLKRRIEALLARPSDYLRRSIVLGMAAVVLTLMASAAVAFASTIHDRRISTAEAGRMAAVAQRASKFPIAVNDRVVKQLNLLLSTPEGRADVQASLGRMRRYESFISRQLVRHAMPLELLAVPLAEAGYRNQAPSGDPRHGAGLWMFIAPTARHFGLTVDSNRDDRLDVAAETGAALRMFSELHHQFDDWGLALLAYYVGSKRVEKAIAQTGSRDVWTLIAQGHENDAGYVARVMAAILILANPDVLD